MITDDQAFDLVAADGLRLSYTSIRDWTMLHPELRGTPFQLYAIMRSLVIDKAGDRSSRRVTLDQLCWLLPGVNSKPTSLTAVKDALRVLDRLGLVTNPDGERLVTSTGDRGIKSRRRFQVNDLPPEGFQGWRNAWDKLDAYREDWRTNTPKPPTINSTPAVEQSLEGRNSDCRDDQAKHSESAGHLEGRNSDHGSRNSDRRGRNSARQPASDLCERALKKSLKEGSLSSVTARPPEADPNEPREREDRSEASTPDLANPIVQAWTEAYNGTPPALAPDAIRRDARRLLAKGLDPNLLRLAAADMARHGWKNLAQHLEHFTPPAPASHAPNTAGPARTAADCPWCDPFGWYETDNGRNARCTHPEHPPAGHPPADTRSAA